jgi:hypothetical protein
LSLNNEIDTQINGHKQNSIDESDEENPDNEQTLNEQVALAAAAAISGDENKQTDPNESDPVNKRMLFFNCQIINIEILLARPMAERTPNPVFEVVPDDVLQVKIADLGNACWTVNFENRIFI